MPLSRDPTMKQDNLGRKVRVLYVHTLPLLTGSGLAVYLMMTGLDRSKYEVELACGGEGRLTDAVLSRGIVYQKISHLVQSVRPFKDLAALVELVLLIRRRKYKIVHTHNSKTGVVGRLAAKVNRVPIILPPLFG